MTQRNGDAHPQNPPKRGFHATAPDSPAALGPGPAGLAADDGPAVTLRAQAVNGRFLIGTAVMSRQLDNAGLADLVAKQFDCLTGENEFKPQSLQPQPGKFNFAAADRIVDFARRHDMKVVGHNLCWHSQTPAWMFRDDNGKPLPATKH